MCRLLVVCAIVGLVAVSLAKPGLVTAQDATPCPPTTEEENEALARRWTEEALNTGDLDVLDEFVAEDVVHDAALYDPLVGRDAVKQALAHLLSGFPGMQFTVLAVVAEGDYVAVQWRGEGVHGGEYFGVPATGTQVAIEGINIYRFACGQIVEGWSEADGVGLLEQLGLVEPATPMDATPAAVTGVATPTDCPTTTEEENRAIALRWYDEVWSQQRYEVVAGLVTGDVAYHWRVGSITIGPEAFRARLESFHNAIPDLRVEPVVVIAGGDLVAMRWNGTGTHTETFLNVEATGAPLEWAGSTIFRFACGRIAEIWVETDFEVRAGSVPDLATPDI
jgi:steroid delta-isomerase-like uncharacterized protein